MIMSGESEQLFLELLREVKREQSAILEKFQEHADTERRSLEDLRRQLADHVDESRGRHEMVLKAFPNDDIQGHNAYHAEVIRWHRLRNEFFQDALKTMAKLGLIGCVVWILKVIVFSFKMEFLK